MEKVRPWGGQPSDQGRLRNRTEQNLGEPVPEEIFFWTLWWKGW